MQILEEKLKRMWASQLLTVQLTVSHSRAAIHFDFTDTPGYTGVDGVEVFMFNCPQWGIGVAAIAMLVSESTLLAGSMACAIVLDTTSCSSVVNSSLHYSTSTYTRIHLHHWRPTCNYYSTYTSRQSLIQFHVRLITVCLLATMFILWRCYYVKHHKHGITEK